VRILTYSAPGAVLPHSLTDVREAFAELGHEVWLQDLEGLANHLPAGETAGLDIAIADGLAQVEPDCVFTIDAAGLVPAYLSALRRPCRIVSWFYDEPFAIFERKAFDTPRIAPDYHVFSWDRSYLDDLRELGIASCEYLPLCTNPAVNYRRDVEPQYDISFVGHATEERARTVAALAEAGLDVSVWGDRWHQLDHEHIHFCGGTDNREGCPTIYSASRINLNVTNEWLRTALPLRVFDVLACGGFLLTDEREDTQRMFLPGEHLVTYRDLDDLVAKAREYLDRPDERARIGRAGREHVIGQFTFRHRMEEALEVIAAAPAPREESARDPGSAALWLVGLGYLKAGRARDASALLHRALRGSPADPDVLLALVALANAEGRLGEAREFAAQLDALESELSACAHDLVAATDKREVATPWSRLYRSLGVGVDDAGRVGAGEPVLFASGAEAPVSSR